MLMGILLLGENLLSPGAAVGNTSTLNLGIATKDARWLSWLSLKRPDR
jgi:hypothetical protein